MEHGMKVYVLQSTQKTVWLSDEDFMELAEEEGSVYSLYGFMKAFNEQEVSTSTDCIKII